MSPPFPRSDPAADFFFQFPPAEEFISGGAEECAVFHSCAEIRTQEIDAKGVAAAEFTPALADKETGFRDFSLRRQRDIQQEIDQEEDRVIPILDALKAATSRGALSTLRASLQDTFLSHGFISAGNRFPVVFEKLVNSLVFPESTPVRVVKRLCLVNLLWDHFLLRVEKFLSKLTRNAGNTGMSFITE